MALCEEDVEDEEELVAFQEEVPEEVPEVDEADLVGFREVEDSPPEVEEVQEVAASAVDVRCARAKIVCSFYSFFCSRWISGVFRLHIAGY